MFSLEFYFFTTALGQSKPQLLDSCLEEDARQWICDPDDGPGSFLWTCWHLGLDPTRIYRVLEDPAALRRVGSIIKLLQSGHESVKHAATNRANFDLASGPRMRVAVNAL